MSIAPSPPSDLALRSDFRVTGMSCGNCVHHVETAVGEVGGIATVDVPGSAVSVLHPATLSPADVAAAIEAEGYGATVVATAEVVPAR
jgi:copper chaperone CopZ